MKNSLKDQTNYFMRRLEQLENLPDDNCIKKGWKSGKISDTLAIYFLELNENLEEDTP